MVKIISYIHQEILAIVFVFVMSLSAFGISVILALFNEFIHTHFLSFLWHSFMSIGVSGLKA
jgi:hypothetical protein